MSQAMSKLWFSDGGENFRGTESCYFERAMFPWVARVEEHWVTIRDELMALVREHESSLVPYVNTTMTSKKDHWKTFGLMFWTVRSKQNCAKVPRTWEILRTIPNITAASFNLLEGGATIKPHFGDTNAIVRCHLGLVIPAPAPECAFRVGREVRSWHEGQFLLFCDAHNHTAWNNTKQRRYILIVDVMRPECVSQKIPIAARVLASIHLEVAYQRHALLGRFFGTRGRKRLLFGLFRAYHWVLLRTGLAQALD